MQKGYSFLSSIVERLLPAVGIFNKKLALATDGRKETFATLKKSLDGLQPVIWMHAASLGEYEQGLPVMKAMQEKYPTHQWVVSFFSPSGYEVKKNNAFAKATIYLPIDTPANARKFLDIVRPEMALFVKYEFWPNYLNELHRRRIRTFLISGVFRKSQPFFKSYGRWMISALESFEFFFLQDENSAAALSELGFTNYTVSGDTRFDRVSQQIVLDNILDFVKRFKDDQICVVCGSTWPEDDEIIANYINKNAASDVKFIIAPHEINADAIMALESRLEVTTIKFSEHTDTSLVNAKVLVIDTIGLLSKIYSYADIAYVGGAMGNTGLHNILEPATFGVPIIIGSHFDKFPEAKRLQQLAGLYAVATQDEFTVMMNKLLADTDFRNQTGMIAGHFINSNTGATNTVMKYLKDSEQ